MAPPLNRREFLQTVAVSSAAVGAGAVSGAASAQSEPQFSRQLPGGDWHYPAQADLIPFGHAVASGDPLADRVILWTRLTIPDRRGWDASVVRDPQGFRRVTVRWVVARDPGMGGRSVIEVLRGSSKLARRSSKTSADVAGRDS